MEMPIGGTTVDPGIVQSVLGSDDKPVYAGPTRTTTNKADFDQWYRDVPGVNMTTEISLQLLQAPGQQGLYEYPGTDFFPIDNQLFGNQGRIHNFHFTLEIATQFKYIGGETFSFTGDDDLWIFINRRLAIDLGGLHPALSASVDLDANASKLGIKAGAIYALHVFFAERHTDKSDFNVETTIADVPSCD
jgi:fibro-slime domain-containing protein